MRLNYGIGICVCGLVWFNQIPQSTPNPENSIAYLPNHPWETNLSVGSLPEPSAPLAKVARPLPSTPASRFIRPAVGKLNFAFGHPPGYPFPELLPHLGHDYDGNIGDPVKAAAAGKVIYAGWDDYLGNCIVIQHTDDYSTTYGHLHEISVEPNQQVEQGQVIGTIGSTGKSTGPHLHFEIRKGGQAKDPVKYGLK